MTPEGSRSSSPSPPLEIHRTRSRSVSVNAPPSATGGVASASATTRTTKAHEPKLKDGAVGRMDATFYRRMMPGWRCDIREALVKSLEREIDELVQLQSNWRTRFRDHYFVKTSLLGTHTFFMVFIPIWAWYGFPEVARGLLYVLAAGGYVTSVLKDAFCVPRPFSPPVHRLSVGSHALEYGFPSTHSSNALSMALFFGELLLRRNSYRPWLVNSIGVVSLIAFAWSITFGRLYTGMHSRMDVRVGASIGVLVWLATSFGEAKLESSVLGTGLNGTLVIVPSLLSLVTFHPQPAENCPCFEDAIAFLSVFAGILLGLAWNPYRYADTTVGFERRDVSDVVLWSAAAGAKLFIGVSCILVWRIVAKFACHRALPPLFRLFAPVFALPRRYYLAATEYGSYPEQTSFNPVPSILDLPSLAEDAELSSHPRSSTTTTTTALATPSSSSSSSSSSLVQQRHPVPPPPPPAAAAGDKSSLAAKLSPTTGGSVSIVNDGTASSPHLRSVAPTTTTTTTTGGGLKGSGPGAGTTGETPVHLDADVLTKVVVYAGIGWGATVTLPWLFAGMGLNVWNGVPAATRNLSRWSGIRLRP